MESTNKVESRSSEGNLAGRVALVTGGSRGIGRATCLALASRGAAVAVLCRSRIREAQGVVEQIQSIGARGLAMEANVLDPEAIKRSAREAIARLGRIDILVNNAGEMTDVSVIDMKDEDWEQALAINLTSSFRYARECIPSMKERRWGRIINVSSQVVYTGSNNHAHYSAAKAGLLGFTFSLAKELGPYGITANVVAPGRILTDLLLERMAGREKEWMSQTPMRRFGRPEEVAAAIAFLASEDASYITGAVINVNGGLVMG
ncbi:MAG TPA: 3-oxoacyl-ACP reductase family protein [Terriglobia bacterium]|nr:3-oxoacyl-ACP reductase family protein [Terriglobia bacterium]